MRAELRRHVCQRAGNRCEYCRLAERHSPVARLQIEHILPRKHGGTDDDANLALACIDCNLHKGSNLTGIDPQTDQLAELFNPRTQKWSDHFAWNGMEIVGLTPVGRATVRVLEMNAEDRIQLRLALGGFTAGS
jgi:5-methylcytosine-specific restriction endonuclease McrA